MLQIGLTGGAAAGKSVVAHWFAAIGAPVVDADTAAREVVAPGTEGLTAVTEAFGTGILADDGALDRAVLRRHVFADADARARLESILHPRIRAHMDIAIEALAGEEHAYCLRAVPLLVETSEHWRCDRVLVVDAPEPVQLRRLGLRDGVDEESARTILAAQADRWTRVAAADDVVANGDDVPPERSVAPQVHALDAKFRALAHRGRAARN